MSSRKASGRANAKFFCDNCGAEVPLEAHACPQCGRSFSSVRCPRCAFAGPPRSFASGCPACGYAAVKEGGRIREEARPARRGIVLPGWVYRILAVALSVLLIASILVLVLRLSR